MKRIKYMLLALSAVMFTACGDDDKLPEITPTETGTVTDDMGNTYEWVRIGGQDWTTTNAKNGPSAADAVYWDGWDWTDAFSSRQKADFNENIYPVYGNYLNYADALATAPEGWRLPTDEDWQRLEQALGIKDPAVSGYRGEGVGYAMQEKETGCKLGLLTGGGMTWKAVFGWKELNLDYIGEYGYYWTATPADPVMGNERAYFRKICSIDGRVDREAGTVENMMMVRWVRDAK